MSSRERRLVSIVATVAVALIVAVIVSIVATGRSTGNGCVHATYAGPVGAEEVYRCGTQARTLCRSLSTSGYTGPAAQAIAGECRKAGLPVDS